MNAFQWIAISGLAVVLLWDLRSLVLAQGHWLWHLARSGLWLLAMACIYQPELTSWLAHRLGIDRGADLVAYGFHFAFLGTTLYFYSRDLQLRTTLTELVRHVAIREAQFGGESHDAADSQAPRYRRDYAMNLLHVVPFFHPATNFGGPVTLLRELLPSLAARGHRLRVITTDNQIGPELQRDCWIERDGYQVWYGRTLWLHRRPPYWSPTLNGVLEREIATADVVHASVGLTLLNESVRHRAARVGVPFLYTPHGCLSPRHLLRRRLSKAVFMRMVERRIIQSAACCQALTAKEAVDLERLGCSRSACAHHTQWRRRNVTRGGGCRGSISSQIRTATGCRRHVVPGPIGRHQGNRSAAAGVCPRSSQAAALYLVLAGPDFGYEVTARRLADELGVAYAVRFTGTLRDRQPREAMAAADLFALTSYAEGLPLGVLEAAACQLALLISTACNIPEVAQYGQGGS